MYYEYQRLFFSNVCMQVKLVNILTYVPPFSYNKKLSCRRETARCFVFVCSQLEHTYSAVFYYQLLWLQIY